ncbi:MAG TPA: phage baseplate assembly protein V [Allosphingosinicella sp.]
MDNQADFQRMIGDLCRLGTVESVNLEEGTCRVEIGDIVTGDVPWLERRAGKTRTWSPPSVGEQVLFLCPESDAEAGLVLCGLPSNSFTAPSVEEVELIEFEDGTTLSYDAAAHKLVVDMAAGGAAEINAPGGVKIVGNVEITGDLTASGTITGTTDVVGAGKSLKSHKHLGVTAGSAVSGAPQ